MIVWLIESVPECAELIRPVPVTYPGQGTSSVMFPTMTMLCVVGAVYVTGIDVSMLVSGRRTLLFGIVMVAAWMLTQMLSRRRIIVSLLGVRSGF